VPTSPDGAPPDAQSLRGMRALVVDDNLTNAAVVEEHLHSWGLDVQTAGNAAQALSLLEAAHARGAPFELALLDLKMPEIDGIALAEAMRRQPALADIRTVLLTSVATDQDARRARDAGVQVYVAKPVRQQELLRALLQAADPVLPAPQPTPPLGAHVLVAEDNAVNSEVLKAMLEAAGCSFALAATGQQALQALQGERFDLVFMDCQMPEMDGFEAVARFRRDGSELNERRLPIVALTANALVGDAERCLAAGFSDYLSKPFTRRQIEAMVRKWVMSPATV
jgi:CheY-like chemotaxis protein